jgi:hypothetical protein
MLTKRDAKALPWVLLIFVVLLLMNPSAAGLKLVMGAIGLCAIGGTVRFVLMLIVTCDYGQKPKPLACYGTRTYQRRRTGITQTQLRDMGVR